MTDILDPFPYFPEAGTGGYIYIGSAGLDARTNPITVYRDVAQTLPWAQPIRTVNGYPAYQGAKAGIYAVPTTISLTVLDDNSRVVTNGTSFETNPADTLRADLASTATGKGASLVGTTSGLNAEERFKTFSVVNREVGIISAAETPANNYARIQAMLDEAANASREGAREVVLRIDGFPQISNSLVMRSNTRLFINGTGALVPQTALGRCINNGGTDPASWLSLTADALKFANAVQVTSTATIAVGSIVFLRSGATLPDTGVDGFNSGGGTVALVPVKCGQIFRVMGKTATMLYFDSYLEYDYLMADTAEVGVVGNATERVRIEGLRWGDPADYALRSILPGVGAVFTYGMDIEMNGTNIWSRPYNGTDNNACSGIGFNHCADVKLQTERMETSYYGETFNGACRNILSIGGHHNRDRHATSLNWTLPYGEPVDVTITDKVATETTLSSYDSHDVGRRLLYRNCKSFSPGDDGFLVRSADVTIESCEVQKASNDAVGPQQSGLRMKVRDLVARNCQFTMRCVNTDVSVDGVDMWDSGAIFPTSGSFKNIRAWSGNTGISGLFRPSANYVAGNRVEIDGVYMPYQVGSQVLFAFGFSDLTGWRVRNINLPGFPTNALGNIFRFAGSTTIAEPDHDVIKFSTAAPTRGSVTLVAGVATVTTDNVISYGGSTVTVSAPPLRSTILLTRMSTGGTPGVHYDVTTVTNGTSFVITARDAAGATATLDTSTVAWQLL
jgi:hypothetical protein